MAKMVQGRKGARRAALKVLKSEGKRTALQSVAAVAAGRTPGKPGAARTVVGSQGGHNAARTADRAAARAWVFVRWNAVSGIGLWFPLVPISNPIPRPT